MASSAWTETCWVCGFAEADFFRLDGIPGATCPLCKWNWDGASGDSRLAEEEVAPLVALIPRINAVLAGAHCDPLITFLTESWHGDLPSLEGAIRGFEAPA